jgi:hypothetical protein
MHKEYDNFRKATWPLGTALTNMKPLDLRWKLLDMEMKMHV